MISDWVVLVMRLLPLLLQGIVSVEQVIGPGNGAIKKAIVLSALPAETPGPVVTAVNGVIDSTVKKLNESGKFQRSTKEQRE